MICLVHWGFSVLCSLRPRKGGIAAMFVIVDLIAASSCFTSSSSFVSGRGAVAAMFMTITLSEACSCFTLSLVSIVRAVVML